ncbi:hypothetical protein BJ742DRAFT_341495 [Cladochytrium replicatum]|nr:hypothetical protein BJ742DRAFT_341495 [Cladochytrium replicatum]
MLKLAPAVWTSYSKCIRPWGMRQLRTSSLVHSETSKGTRAPKPKRSSSKVKLKLDRNDDRTIQLETLSRTDLSEIARDIGVYSQAGMRKQDLIDTIKHDILSVPTKPSLRVVGIDVGLKNISFCEIEFTSPSSPSTPPNLNFSFSVRRWERFELSLPAVNEGAYNPLVFARGLIDGIDRRIVPPNLHPPVDHIVVERAPTMSPMRTPLILQRVAALESMLLAILVDRHPDKLGIINAVAVRTHFDRRSTGWNPTLDETVRGMVGGKLKTPKARKIIEPGDGILKDQKRYRTKKKDAVAVVKGWATGEKSRPGLNIDEKESAMFMSEKKKDDLSDSLMITLAKCEWIAGTLFWKTLVNNENSLS